jgi:hypothetical protein
MEALKHAFAPRLIAALATAGSLFVAAPAFAAPSVTINSVDPAAPVPGDTVTFQASSPSRISSWSWDYDYRGGSGHFVQGTAKGSHQYTARGSYTAVVVAQDNNGNTGYTYKKVVVDRAPEASFTSDPASPAPGQTITFTQTAVAPDGGQIKSYGWDLNGDGTYDDSTDPTATTSFPADGDYTVGLRVVDDLGLASTTTQTINVATPPPPPPPPASFDTAPVPGPEPAPQANPLGPTSSLAQFSPRPFIHIKGRTTGRGARVNLFTVRAAVGAKVVVRCIGKRCPAKGATRVVKGRRVKSGRATAGTVRFRAVEHLLRAGIVLEVRVTKKGYVGRYTRFRIGRLKPPVRWDGCLLPGHKGPSEC